MEKRVIKSLIVEKQNEISSIELIERPLELETTGNYIFVGLRRAGKSYFLYQHVHRLIQSGQASIKLPLVVGSSPKKSSHSHLKNILLSIMLLYIEIGNTVKYVHK